MSDKLKRSDAYQFDPTIPFDPTFFRLGATSLSIELPTRAAPPVDIFGYWRGESGAVLRFRRDGDRAIKVSGTALDQKVHGKGAIDGDRVKIRLTLPADPFELMLDLALPGSASGSDVLAGTACDRSGNDGKASFSRLAPDVDGTWRELHETSLRFGEPVLDWFDGEQQVRVDVEGSIFGRSACGQVELRDGRRVSGALDAADHSHHNDYVKRVFADQPFIRASRLKELYERECPKEGWWATNTVLLSMEVSPDVRWMSGTVKPCGRTDRNNKIEEHVHLERDLGPRTRAAKSVL